MSPKVDIYRDALSLAAEHSQKWLDSIAIRDVNPKMNADEIKAGLGVELPDGPTAPATVVESLAEVGESGLMAMSSGRFFGWVVGGTLPAALAADWTVSAWDQNSASRIATPTTAAVEEIASKWLLEILGLPATADVGFPTDGELHWINRSASKSIDRCWLGSRSKRFNRRTTRSRASGCRETRHS